MYANVQSKVVIVGAGFGGIAAAIELQRHGFSDITILEKATEPGGTWFHNSYPGAACDVPSHLYSYSFAQRRDWTRLCSPQEEILRYLQGVSRTYGLDRITVPGSTVSSCVWDDEDLQWTVTTTDGRTYDAGAVVLATGQLHQPAFPRLQDAESFEGHSFHSAEWDHEYDLTGKRVAVIGTGASAVQFVPEIAKQVAALSVFQRSGNWFLNRKNRPYPALAMKAIDRIPGLQSARRRFLYHYGEVLTAAIRHPNTLGRLVYFRSASFMRSQLKDPEVRAKAWPDYTFGCKRVLFSSHYLPALQRPNVDLVTDRVTGLTPAGVRTEDGREHPVDCIIYGTGFRTNDFMFPMQVTGTDGRDLATDWEGGAHAHLGISMPGFPSLFVMYGPNTNTSGGSIIVYLEAQAQYIRQALETVRDRGARALMVRADVESASDAALQQQFAGTAWTLCDSWYRTDEGRIVANWPGYMREYEAATRQLDPAQFAYIGMSGDVATESLPVETSSH
ncbi:Baeyer-Villiger monooxygenase [Paraconexibacter sp. AEG42_29]|uniref:Baeyer-Villiger monooxygenase n=1 Tax=Paraconexibacter sp. AEG42_29 TaxID=2997339 RepID=A0AAU7AQJ5_9ACTN